MLLRAPRCGNLGAMALPKSTKATRHPLIPGLAGSTSVNEPTAPPRVTLPKNLPTTLQGLGDIELETLQRAIDAEIKRRSRGGLDIKVPGPKAIATAKASDAKIPAGKANLILASFQTGMKPSAIARTLRVSQAVVNEVLGTQAKPRR